MKLQSEGIASLSSTCCAPKGMEMCWNFVYPWDWSPGQSLQLQSIHDDTWSVTTLRSFWSHPAFSCLPMYLPWHVWCSVFPQSDPSLPPCPWSLSWTAELEHKAPFPKYLVLREDLESRSSANIITNRLSVLFFSHHTVCRPVGQPRLYPQPVREACPLNGMSFEWAVISSSQPSWKDTPLGWHTFSYVELSPTAPVILPCPSTHVNPLQPVVMCQDWAIVYIICTSQTLFSCFSPYCAVSLHT